jgi:hypothetical protein
VYQIVYELDALTEEVCLTAYSAVNAAEECADGVMVNTAPPQRGRARYRVLRGAAGDDAAGGPPPPPPPPPSRAVPGARKRARTEEEEEEEEAAAREEALFAQETPIPEDDDGDVIVADYGGAAAEDERLPSLRTPATGAAESPVTALQSWPQPHGGHVRAAGGAAAAAAAPACTAAAAAAHRQALVAAEADARRNRDAANGTLTWRAAEVAAAGAKLTAAEAEERVASLNALRAVAEHQFALQQLRAAAP